MQNKNIRDMSKFLCRTALGPYCLAIYLRHNKGRGHSTTEIYRAASREFAMDKLHLHHVSLGRDRYVFTDTATRAQEMYLLRIAPDETGRTKLHISIVAEESRESYRLAMSDEAAVPMQMAADEVTVKKFFVDPICSK